MTQEALKLALEAMESVTVECNNFHHPKKDQNHHWAKCPPVGRWDKAITAIKEALAQIEQKQDGDCKYCTDGCPACDAKKLPAQRTWVGLTPDEIRGISLASGESLFSAIMFTHDKLKEKNT